MVAFAEQMKCPACGEYFLVHSNSKLKRCDLILRICSFDKERTFHISTQVIWIFFITLPWIPKINSEVNKKLFGVFLDYQILFPMVNMILFWIVICIDEKMNKKYISTLSQGGKEE